ncbi:MAG: DUF4173 domain-containing protein [Clostridia bacterium]|nr:DUF4173 domain-containing protein [Clostridia bacterium]
MNTNPDPKNPYTNPYFTSPSSPFFETPQASKPSFSTFDTVFAWCSIAVGVLFIRTLPVAGNTLGGMLVAWLLFGFATFYFLRSGIKPGRQPLSFAAAACTLSLGLITSANATLHRLLFFFLLCAFSYYVYSICGLAGGKILDGRCSLHALYATVVLPLMGLPHIFPALSLRNRRSSSPALRTLGWVLIGIGIAVIPTAIVILLLSYDEQFTNLLRSLFSFSPKPILELLRDLLLGFAVAVGLFGLLFEAKRQRKDRNGEEKSLPSANLHVLPKALLCGAVTPILAVYVLFFVSQWSYYVSAFTHQLPEGLTYADYARGGFFELCWVTAINAAILLLFHLLIKRGERDRGILNAIYSVLFSLATLILIATALSKMLLYIDSYGLTQKRVYASLLMLLFAVSFLAVLVAQFVKKLRLLPTILVLCLVFFGLAVLPNVDGMIADYNVDTYLSGDLPDVDVETLASYGEASVPALHRLYKALGERETLTKAEQGICARTETLLIGFTQDMLEEKASIFAFNLPRHLAKGELREFAEGLWGDTWRDAVKDLVTN